MLVDFLALLVSRRKVYYCVIDEYIIYDGFIVGPFIYI